MPEELPQIRGYAAENWFELVGEFQEAERISSSGAPPRV
jgi:hypothetical protein